MFITQCDGGIRRFFRFEAFTDERHDKDAKKVMIPTTDMSCLFTETVIFQILGYIAQFRTIQTDASRGRDKKGSGLGLSIVKEIIQAHEEHIDVISTKDVGTEFIFTLPLDKK